MPDEVAARLARLAERDGTSVAAVAVRELTDVSRRADNSELLGGLPDHDVETGAIVDSLEAERDLR